MSSESFNATLDLTPRPSLGVLMALFWLHSGAAILILLAMPAGAPMAITVCLVGFSWLSLRRRAALGFGPRALTRLTWHADGNWTVHDASGMTSGAELQGSSLVHLRLLVLIFKLAAGGRRTRILAGDEISADQLRQLQARLKLLKKR